MKALHKYLGFILFLGFSFSLFSQSPPPGTVKFKPSKTGVKHAAYIDGGVITVQSWRDFLWWTEQEYGKESAEYKTSLPDTLIGAYPNSWIHPKNQNLPIVGITYEQAIKFCKWRSDRVNEWLKLQKNKKKYGYTATYSLPTETDFQEAYNQRIIKYFYPYLYPINELTAEKTVMIKVWRLTFKPYEEYKECEIHNSFIGFRCVAEIEIIKK